MIITKITLSYDDGSTHDFMSMEDAAAHAVANTLPDPAPSTSETAPEDHATPQEDSAAAASEAPASAEDAEQGTEAVA